VNALTAEEEVFFRRLLNVVDDYGRFHADARLLRSACYPLREETTSAQCRAWLDALIRTDLVRAYVADEKSYLEVRRFGCQMRSRSKFPAPPPDAPDVPENPPPPQSRTSIAHCETPPPPPAPEQTPAQPPAPQWLLPANTCERPVTTCEQPLTYNDNDIRIPPLPPKGGTRAAALSDAFATFWAAYPPTGRRRSSQSKCLTLWRRLRLDAPGAADAVLADLRARTAGADWTKSGGQYVPAAHRYLRDKMFADAILSSPHSATAQKNCAPRNSALDAGTNLADILEAEGLTGD
jgi:hypothetical protein